MKLAFTLIVLATGIVLASTNSQMVTSEKIHELHKERISTLKRMADMNIAAFKKGESSYEEAFQARLLLHEAELDASETGQERIKCCENIVELSKEKEANLPASFNRGEVNAATMLKAKADRLKAEIELERAKSGH